MRTDSFYTCSMNLLGGLKYLALGIIAIIEFPFDLIACALYKLSILIEGE